MCDGILSLADNGSFVSILGEVHIIDPLQQDISHSLSAPLPGPLVARTLGGQRFESCRANLWLKHSNTNKSPPV